MKGGQYSEVKGYAVIDPERFNDFLNRFIERSERWMKDAKNRDDLHEIGFIIKGKKKLLRN
jgi:hypothetical protein